MIGHGSLNKMLPTLSIVVNCQSVGDGKLEKRSPHQRTNY